MIKWPWVSRKKYEAVLVLLRMEELNLSTWRRLAKVRGATIERLTEELKEARKNDHRDEKGRFKHE